MKIAKKLSANDIGATGGHQAGILVPKAPEILSFFPPLPKAEKNPRAAVVVREKVSGTRWEFNFIYYNNRFFGGTRNEYRLTKMTAYLRAIAATVGDELILSKDSNGSIHVELVRTPGRRFRSSDDAVLELGSGWVYINL